MKTADVTPWSILIMVTTHVLADSNCNDDRVRGKCGCRKYFVCNDEQWEERNVPNSMKYSDLCPSCSGTHSNGCSNNDEYVPCDVNDLLLGGEEDSTVESNTDISTTDIAYFPTAESGTDILAADGMCPCDCDYMDKLQLWEIQNSSQTMTESDPVLVSKMKEMKKQLAMNTSELSATKNKKISASDKRTSAAVAGWFGLAFLVIVFGSLVLLDFPTLASQLHYHAKRFYKDCKRLPRKRTSRGI